MNDTDVTLPGGAIAALESGQMIEAIKIVREATGLGLKESKDTVDRYLAAHPELAERTRAAGAGGGRTVLLWLALLATAVAVAMFLVQRRP